jgi:flagellar protein FlgJ
MSIQDMGSQFALDVQGLERLKHTARNDEAAGLRGAAQQFEALFLQMMLKSMRDTIPSGGMLDSQQTEFYQSMMDQQWAQTMAGRGIGLADHLVAQLENQLGLSSPRSGVADRELSELIAGIPRGTPRVLQDALHPATEGEERPAERAATNSPQEADPVTMPAHFLEELETVRGGFMAALDARLPASAPASAPATVPPASSSPVARASARSGSTGQGQEHVQRFMERLSAPAQAASRKTGVPAELILAQAALETGWGRHEIATADGRNSYNLFGIKAGSSWQGRTTDIVTHEYINGQRTRVVDTFRVYNSFEEAFTDYARLISDNPRYAGVVSAPNAERAAHALQAGGYATDPRYASKLIAVMNSMGPLESSRTLAGVFFSY